MSESKDRFECGGCGKIFDDFIPYMIHSMLDCSSKKHGNGTKDSTEAKKPISVKKPSIKTKIKDKSDIRKEFEKSRKTHSVVKARMPSPKSLSKKSKHSFRPPHPTPKLKGGALKLFKFIFGQEASSESETKKSHSSQCGECPGCLFQEDCMECEVCLKKIEDPDLDEICILRKCSREQKRFIQEQMKENEQQQRMHAKKKSAHSYQSNEGSFGHLPEVSSESEKKSHSSQCGECPGPQEDCMECEVSLKKIEDPDLDEICILRECTREQHSKLADHNCIKDEHMKNRCGSDNERRQLKQHFKKYCPQSRSSLEHDEFKLHVEEKHQMFLPKTNSSNNERRQLRQHFKKYCPPCRSSFAPDEFKLHVEEKHDFFLAKTNSSNLFF